MPLQVLQHRVGHCRDALHLARCVPGFQDQLGRLGLFIRVVNTCHGPEKGVAALWDSNAYAEHMQRAHPAVAEWMDLATEDLQRNIPVKPLHWPARAFLYNPFGSRCSHTSSGTRMYTCTRTVSVLFCRCLLLIVAVGM